MRTPLQATQSVTLTHTVRKGTQTSSYTVALAQVSCHESDSVYPSGPGFAHQNGRISGTTLCIFSQYSAVDLAEAAGLAGELYLAPEAFRAADEAARASHWTLALEDKVTLPSGRTATVTSIQDNRTGRLPHWYVGVS